MDRQRRTNRPAAGFYSVLSGKPTKAKQKIKFPCIICCEEVRDDDRAVLCEGCNFWQHIGCGKSGISAKAYDKAVKGN